MKFNKKCIKTVVEENVSVIFEALRGGIPKT